MLNVVIYDVEKVLPPGSLEREYRVSVTANCFRHLRDVRQYCSLKDISVQRYALGRVNPTSSDDSITLHQKIAHRLQGEYHHESRGLWHDYVSFRGKERRNVRKFIQDSQKFKIDDGNPLPLSQKKLLHQNKLFNQKKLFRNISSPPVDLPRAPRIWPYLVVYDTGVYFTNNSSLRGYRIGITDSLEEHLDDTRTEFSLRPEGQVHRFAYSQFTQTAPGFNPLEVLRHLAGVFDGMVHGNSNPWEYRAEFSGPVRRKKLREEFIDHRFLIDDGDFALREEPRRRVKPTGPRYTETITWLGFPRSPSKRTG